MVVVPGRHSRRPTNAVLGYKSPYTWIISKEDGLYSNPMNNDLRTCEWQFNSCKTGYETLASNWYTNKLLEKEQRVATSFRTYDSFSPFVSSFPNPVLVLASFGHLLRLRLTWDGKFVQQPTLRYISDREHTTGPFMCTTMVHLTKSPLNIKPKSSIGWRLNPLGVCTFYLLLQLYTAMKFIQTPVHQIRALNHWLETQ